MKRISILLCVVMLATVLPFGALAQEGTTGMETVKTEFGLVSGVAGERKEVTVFKGVPYAEPPVGELRWYEPVDPTPWEDVKVCDTYAPAAMQPAYTERLMNPQSDFYPTGEPVQSEDCLYLNITTPAVSADEKLPVMVWFHGGSLNHGYSWQVPFDGESLASEGVIVVTVGHRLNIMGFLSLPQLSEASGYGASGNYGLMDCVKSVQWVHDNIAAFGGDPENIMVYGQSGGATKTAAIVASPKAKGLVSTFAMQSGGSVFDTNLTLEESEEKGLAFLDSIGVSRDATLEELRAIPAETLASADAATSSSINIDNYYVDQNNIDFFLGEGNLEGIDMMAGFVFGETAAYEATNADELFAMVRTEFGDELVDKYDLENSMLINDSNVGWYNIYLKSAARIAPLRLYAQLKEAINTDSETYLYMFGRITPNKTMGWHSGELWYTFNNMDYSFEGMDTQWQPTWEAYDYIVGNISAKYWTNFAKTGNPNGDGLDAWPQANAETMAYQYIDSIGSSFDTLTSFDEMLMEYYTNLYGLN